MWQVAFAMHGSLALNGPSRLMGAPTKEPIRCLLVVQWRLLSGLSWVEQGRRRAVRSSCCHQFMGLGRTDSHGGGRNEPHFLFGVIRLKIE